ncbi:MAG: CPBP family intramembrane metalloprotease [Bacteroidales bacterium]|nr:CPBP family intramembrane metalloprotease [Bacteroidales bacterium]
MQFPLIKNASQGAKLLTFILLLIFGLLFSSILSAFFLLSGDGMNDITNLQIGQVISQVFGFMLPPILYVMLVKEKPFNYLGFKKLQPWSLLGIVAIFTVIPFLAMVTEWNDNVSLPESMATLEQMLRNIQQLANETTEKFMTEGSLFSGLLIVAALAAISEELLFRSVIQKAFVKICKNAHIGIILTAIVFSAFHGDFFGFVPRFILGLMLGYMFYLSGSIFPSMLMHFVNNGTIVMLYYLNKKEVINVDIETFGLTDNWLVIILSLVITVAIFITCWRLNKKANVISTETE